MDRSLYKRLGDYIEKCEGRNSQGLYGEEDVLGVNNEGNIVKSKAKLHGVDLSPYKIVKNNNFVYNPARLDLGSISLYKGEGCVVSTLYVVFKVREDKEEELLTDYLDLWLKRKEFHRYVGYVNWGSAREYFWYDNITEVMLPIPPIEEQRRIVSEYQTVERRTRNNEAMIQKLEETAQAIYHHTFVDGIDENNLPEGWRMGCLGDVAEYVKERISTCDLEERQYLSTEDIEKDKKGIDKSSSTPDNTNVTAFRKGDILISNIRPYFKKIWLASFDGGCSTDVLCYRTKEKEFHKFLYYTLLEDKFFDYVVAGCKGTKMPRGDKDWNMQYPILVPSKKSLNDYSLKVKPLLNYSSSIVAETSHLRTLLSLLTSKLS